jgi:hypothetical protein
MFIRHQSFCWFLPKKTFLCHEKEYQETSVEKTYGYSFAGERTTGHSGRFNNHRVLSNRVFLPRIIPLPLYKHLFLTCNCPKITLP